MAEYGIMTQTDSQGKHNLSDETKTFLRIMQRNELTEHFIYKKIAARTRGAHNSGILMEIARDEQEHARIWASYLGETVKPNTFKIHFAYLLSRIFGFTFVLKLMENGEHRANIAYSEKIREIPEAKRIAEDEEKHEAKLIDMLDEERLKYFGSMVLGLSDALVELTGVLAGLTFAVGSTKYVALSGLITGVSAAFSMGASEYLSSRAENGKNALKAASYTTAVYFITVILLVAPYLIFGEGQNMQALATMLLTVVVIIAGFTWYMSVTKNLSFKKRFAEMACISLGVAAFSFAIGLVISKALGISNL